MGSKNRAKKPNTTTNFMPPHETAAATKQPFSPHKERERETHTHEINSGAVFFFFFSGRFMVSLPPPPPSRNLTTTERSGDWRSCKEQQRRKGKGGIGVPLSLPTTNSKLMALSLSPSLPVASEYKNDFLRPERGGKQERALILNLRRLIFKINVCGCCHCLVSGAGVNSKALTSGCLPTAISPTQSKL